MACPSRWAVKNQSPRVAEASIYDFTMMTIHTRCTMQNDTKQMLLLNRKE